MLKLLKSLLLLVIAVTERALRPEARPRCIRGGSLAARAARRRQFAHSLDPAEDVSGSSVATAKS